MTAIKKIRKYLAANPTEAASRILVRFVLALELLDEWRLDRYYTAKGQLLDVALQLSETVPAPKK